MRLVSHQLKRLFHFSRLCIGAVIGGLLACATATAQPQYQFDHWTTDDGLPQNAINAILQTRDGYLWLATYDGLVRFDGLQFTVFDKGNTEGIGSNRFAMLVEDRHGALWAVTDEDLWIKYQAGVFTTYTPRDWRPSWSTVRIEQDDAGDLQIVSRTGIAKWKDGRFITYAVEDLMPTPPDALWVDGNMLARLGADRLYLYTRGRLTTHSIQSGLPSLDISSVFEDQHGIVWIITKDAGLVRVKDSDCTVYRAEDGLPSNQGFVPTQEDRKGNIWSAGFGQWLGQLKDGRFTRFSSVPGFPASAIMCFYEDRERNFWIGTANGLYRAREATVTVYTQQDGLSSDNIYSIYEDRAGSLWFGAWGDGVTKYRDGRFTHYRAKDGLATEFITALYEDREGRMWIGNTLGLSRFEDDRLSVYPDPDGLFRGGVWAIHQDRGGRFWFGTSNGLIKYEDGRYTRYTTADNLAGNDVKAILEDRAGQLWFGTWGGLTRYREGQFTSYTEQDGLASNHIRALYEDAGGILWIGTYDGGLGRFKDSRFTRYTTRDGLFNNGVFQLLEDERGYLWMSCNKGIYRVAREELNDFADGKIRSITSIAYGKKDGLLTVECNGGRQPAGWKTRDKRLWFPTAQGVAVIDPSRIEPNRQPPPILIEQFRLSNESVPLAEVIEIPPEKNNNLEIRYQGLSFIQPEQQRYKYRLAGIDHDWVEVGSRRAAYYSRLPPGKYTFTVLAANSDGIWNIQGASLRLVVLPSIWQTWWFKLGSLASIIGLVLLAFQRRIIRLKREQLMRDTHSRQLIDSQERDRQRIAGDLHDGLGQLANLISHHARDGLGEPENYDLVTEHFARIASFADETIRDMRHIVYNLRPPEIGRLGLTRALEALIHRLNASSTIEFICDIDEIDSAFDDDGKVHLYRIVQESLNNVVRHSQASEARLIIKRETKAVRVEIYDNGQGFDVTAASNGNRSRPNLGLPGITERARLLGGRAEIRSTPGQGTKVIAMIPCQEGTS